MVLSMTGYGRAGALLHGRDIKVELRSVNARFFEYSSRLPRSCAFLEDKLKKSGIQSAALRKTPWCRSTGSWPRATAPP